MKAIAIALMLVPFVSGIAQAELKLASPTELLEKAKLGRVDCREVILDIQQNIPEMRDPETFDSYFYILDNLSLIAEQTGVNEIYPNAVKSLGLQMVSNGIRWLSASKDSFARISYYHKWMSVNVAFSFLSNAELEEKTLVDSSDAAKNFAENIDKLIPLIDRTYPTATSLKLGYRNLISERAAKELGKSNLSEEDNLFWLSKLYSPVGFGSALNFIQNEMLTVTQAEKAKLHKLIRKLLVLSDRIFSDETNQVVWLVNQAAETSVLAITRMVAFQEVFSVNEFRALLKVLQPSQLQGLSQQWQSRPVHPNYMEEYIKLTEILIPALNENGLTKEVTDLRQFLSKIAAPVAAKTKKLEGTYIVSSANGKKWIFTAVLARQATIYVALGDAKGFVHKSFFNVAYGIEENTFVASEREFDSDSYRNLTLKFKLLGNGKIEVRDLMARPSEQYLTGKKIENYPNYFEQSSETPVNPSGTYEGVVYFGKDFSKKLTLVVTGFDGYTLGRMFDDDNNMYVDLNMGTRGTDSVLYLTTGRLHPTNWIQLRGVIKNGEYRGYVVNGGRGIANKEFVLKKISD